MNQKTKPAHYLVLDAARGIAALVVFVYHLKTFVFPNIQAPSFFTLSASYLAVDLFFLMSGIVLAKAYGEKILSHQISFSQFIKIRFIRLYPLYVMGIVLGVGYVLIKLLIHHEFETTPGDFSRSLLLNLLFIPDLWNEQGIFVFDPAAWSLALEWLINIIFVLVLIKLRHNLLALVIVASAGILLFLGLEHGHLDLGWSKDNLGGGIARITFSFSLGILLYNLLEKVQNAIKPLHWAVSVILLLCLTGALVPPAFLHSVFYDFFLVYLFFPVFCLLACVTAYPQALARLFTIVGQTSYALYILHTPLILWFAGMWKLFVHEEPQANASITFPLIVALVTLTSYGATLWFDEPVRKIIGQFLKRPTSQKP